LASETNYTLNATTHQWKRQLAAEAAAEAARASVTEAARASVTEKLLTIIGCASQNRVGRVPSNTCASKMNYKPLLKKWHRASLTLPTVTVTLVTHGGDSRTALYI
jgi:hypothetical protein